MPQAFSIFFLTLMMCKCVLDILGSTLREKEWHQVTLPVNTSRAGIWSAWKQPSILCKFRHLCHWFGDQYLQVWVRQKYATQISNWAPQLGDWLWGYSWVIKESYSKIIELPNRGELLERSCAKPGLYFKRVLGTNALVLKC